MPNYNFSVYFILPLGFLFSGDFNFMFTESTLPVFSMGLSLKPIFKIDSFISFKFSEMSPFSTLVSLKEF